MDNESMNGSQIKYDFTVTNRWIFKVAFSPRCLTNHRIPQQVDLINAFCLHICVQQLPSHKSVFLTRCGKSFYFPPPQVFIYVIVGLTKCSLFLCVLLSLGGRVQTMCTSTAVSSVSVCDVMLRVLQEIVAATNVNVRALHTDPHV